MPDRLVSHDGCGQLFAVVASVCGVGGKIMYCWSDCGLALYGTDPSRKRLRTLLVLADEEMATSYDGFTA